MKQIVQNLRTGELAVEEVPPPALKRSGVLVKNLYSLISAGTERTKVTTGQSSLLAKAMKRPDLVNLVLDNVKRDGLLNTYQKVIHRLDSPNSLGYSSAGVIIQVSKDVDEFRPGDRVACAGEGYACHAEIVFVPKNLCVPLSPEIDFREAAFSTLGSIALQGVRQAEVGVGDYVAVIGLGLVGLLTVQILKACGCRVIGLDINPDALSLAGELGADQTILTGEAGLEAKVASFAAGYGADRVIITAASASNGPVDLACRIARDRGIVVIVGAVKSDVPRNLGYEKELAIKFSRSYGPGRYDANYEEGGIDYPIGYVRWTERRNMTAFLQLVSEKKLNLERMITHVFPFDEAPKAYELITGATGQKYLAVLLKYQHAMENPSNISSASRIYLKKNIPAITPKERQLTVGFIGAGNFAQGYLIPALKSLKGVQLRGVATARGINAHSVAKKFGFSFCTSDHAEILEDPEICCIFIATRHDLHADLVVKALQHNKHVFVEKPLALSEEELTAVIAAYRTSPGELMVGFNRRFSPLIHEVKQFLGSLRTPLTIHYRINAGFSPKTHWAQDPIEGGGRILGEVCHFVDLIQYLTEAEPIKVYAESISSNNSRIVNTDNINITIKLQDGSIGIITYVSMGDTSLGKERIEIFSDNSTAIINDFKFAELYRDQKLKKIREHGKGHREEIAAFVDAMIDGNPAPISFENLVSTTMTTIKIIDSLDSGTPICISGPRAETLDINEGRDDHCSTHEV